MTTKTVTTGITRFDLDEKNVHGFMVRICRNGKHINEFFSDARCGGKRKARKAADDRYAELLDEFGPAPHPTKNKLTARNTSGRVGVHVAHSISTRWPGCEYWAYCASWVNPDRSRGKMNFSWNKYGEQNAWELATLARKHQSTDREYILELHSNSKKAKLKRKTTKPKPR